MIETLNKFKKGKRVKKDFHVRQATQDDIQEIGILWVELMDYHAALDPLFKRSANGRESFENFVLKNMQGDEHQIIVAVNANGELIGFCQAGITEYFDVFEHRTCGYIFDMFVSDKHRREGIGFALYSEAKKWFDEKKITRIELSLFTQNKASSAFWQSIGFHTFMERRRLEVAESFY